jgi:hypothetical protein
MPGRTSIVTETPPLRQMRAWWATMWTDPADLRPACAEGLPHAPDDLLALVRHTARPFGMGLKDEEPLGAVWLHARL